LAETLTQAIPQGSRIDTTVPAHVLDEPVPVVYFVPQLTVGGTEAQLAELVLRLDRKKFTPMVWSPGPWGPVGDELRQHGVPIFRFQLSARRPLSFLRSVRWLRRTKTMVFHSFGYGDHWLDVLAARCARIPHCITCRRNVRHWDQARRVRWSERLRNRWTDQVVANCAAAARVCAEVECIPNEKIQVIYNGVELGESKPELEQRRSLGIGPTDLLLGNVANLKRVKGQDILIRAFRQVVDEMPGTRLAICGEGEEAFLLKRLCEELGLSKQVFFLGLCHDLKPFYGSLDLYVHSSRAEGLSNSILEAMAYGVPVVATEAGGTAELLGHARDYLVPPNDVTALANAMLRALQNPTLRLQQSLAGKNKAAARFTVSRMVAEHESMYLCLLRKTATAFRSQML